ncbi:tetratricopeptide repeat protein [Pyxidicoccus parkwayensis]|uniref:Tetratricopeptide repeat protein n=1 Tax=Pyxidicoccus parkwayensis TaxID=2813578 RepID=A0ABX7NQ29_9BACT|nr:tetratricopeptide repeat protein [Pyxidicoccus parkwaysis]QSQ20548.1 tetratricopeptide repeat protein [Pyxidicoccus parkwaysis]
MAKSSSRKSPAKAKKTAARAAPAKAKKPAPRKVVAEVTTPDPTQPRPPVLEAEPVLDTESAAESPRALPAGESSGRVLPFEIDPKRMEEGLRKLQGEVVHWANKGRYTRVRFKFRGKQLLPDLPLAAVVAAEGLTFYWGGILRMLIANVVGGSVFQVELVNDAEKRVQAGKEALLSGDVDQALAHFREAVAMDRDLASAHLNVGVALKLKGDREGALAAFEKAKEKDPEGGIGAEAERLAAPLRPQGSARSA